MDAVWNNEHGKAFLELAFVLPFLLWTGFGTIEAMSDSRYRQHMSAASREIARAVFPRCIIEHSDPAMRKADVEACLLDAVENVLPGSGGGALPGATAIAGLWEFTDAASDATLIGRIDSGSNVSRYNGSIVRQLHSYTAEKRIIFTVEVFYSRQPLIEWFTGRYYETTII